MVLADPMGGVINAFDFAVQKATAFYASALGWRVGEFGGMPVFLAEGTQVASVHEAPPGVPAHWLSYIAVPDLAAARARLVELGGTVRVEEIRVPTVGTFAVASSPEGATFCPFQPE